MVSGKNSPYDCGQLIVDITTTTFTRAKKRWRMAYAALYAVRVMLSLPKELMYKRSNYKDYSEISEYGSFGSFQALKGSQREREDSYSGLKHGAKGSAPLELQDYESRSYTSLDVKPSTSHDETGHYGSVPNNIDHEGLAKMVKEKDMVALRKFGGVTGITTSLGSNQENGLLGNDIEINKRRELFGSNTYPKPPSKGLFYFVVEALKDMTILILCVCAALALAFGIKEYGVEEGWYEGGSIFVAVFIVIVVSALSNFRQEIQFDKLSKISSNIKVEVFRDRHRKEISIFDVVVGDVVFLNIGDQIPADGMFLDGYSFQVDESSMTGESDYVEVDSTKNPFLLSGAKVADGYGRMLVTSVGMNTAWGEMMSSISQESNVRTPLQARLDKLTSSIGKVGLAVAFLVLLVLLIRYFTGNTKDKNGNKEYIGSKTKTDDVLNAVVRIVSAAVTIVVVAIPEGLPLAVTLTLAYSMKRMMKDQAMVRKLSACETMGSATVICTDKTGTLTLNQMKVTKFWVGQDSIEEDNSSITPNVRELFYQGVGLNTTGSVFQPLTGSKPEISGSPTEKAMLYWVVLDLGMDMEELKPRYDILHVETFNSDKKRSGVLIKKKDDNTIHVHWKGAAEMIVATCSRYYDTNGTVNPLDVDTRSKLEKIIQGMAASSLRCIAFAHAQISEEEIEYSDEDRTHQRLKEDGLILLGIVGLKDPCRPGVIDAVKVCKAAGVDIKMITGDNIFTAKAIATECGILKKENQLTDGQVVEGAEFRNYTDAERMQKVDKIRVMARSSPFDKFLMVQCLKQKGHVVAVTGDGTNDAPALKEADIGLSMGIQGTEFQGESIFNVTAAVNDTLIFNTFVLCQVFNEFNSRSMEKKNVFKGILRNRLFIGIVGVTIVLQVVMVEFLKKFADTEKLNVKQWVVCIVIAAVSWPLGWAVKFIPVSEDPYFRIIKKSLVRFKNIL
ncbi:hypothetical protein ACLB2K_019611 [Fragaria x ananassa]